jgi:phosphate:Na+ symporter
MEIIYAVLGGLGLFLFGLRLMSTSLKNIGGKKLVNFLAKTTDTPLKGLVTGTLVTAFIQSSSATTSITLGLISSGLLTLNQGFAIILGSNIGTTVTPIIIGLNLSDHALPLIALGAFLTLIFKKEKVRLVGSAILGLGMLFFGLELISSQLLDLTSTGFFKDSISSMSHNSMLGFLVGTVFTAVIFSSSAIIGIVQKIYESRSMELVVAIPILLGANVGTTLTSVFSLIGSSVEAKRTALANIIFNFAGAVIFIIILGPFTSLNQLIEDRFLKPYSMHTIAIAHIIFNVISTVIMFFFIDPLVKLVTRMIPGDSRGNDLILDKDWI